MTGSLSVVVVDDNASFRDGLRSMLAIEPDIAVVAEAADGAAGVRAAIEHQPDVVLMDLSMPGTDGVTATRELAAAAPHVGVVALTLRADDEAVTAALTAGARGYVVKGAKRSEILWAVRAVARGEAVFGPAVAARIAGIFAVATAPGPAADPFPGLTERERHVLRLMANHSGNSAIARQLGISEKTVRNHVSNVLAKLQASDRAQAIIMARDAGIG